LFNNRRKAAIKLLSGGNTASNTAGQGLNIGGKIGTSGINASTFLQNSLNPNNQFMYDIKEPAYCYCNKGSFGEMVMCENPFC